MARMKVTHEPDDSAERVADAAMRAAEAQAEAEGSTLKDAIVMIRLDTNEAATAGHSAAGDADAAWLADHLLHHLGALLKSQGMSLHVGHLAEPGQG